MYMSYANVCPQPAHGRCEMLQPTAVLVEDDEGWRRSIENYIIRNSHIEFRRFVSGSSIEEVREELESANEPVVILMDLRLGEEDANYRGLHWLLEELGTFRSSRASSLVFVISGYLNDALKEALLRRGIPRDHIYEKDYWVEQREKFLDVMVEGIHQIDEIALENIANGRSGYNIDRYLMRVFEAVEQFNEDLAEGRSSPGEPVLLPMVVQARDKFWDYSGIPQLQILGRIGNIFSCLGSPRTVTALERNPDVLSVEASRPAMPVECDKSIPFIQADVVHREWNETGDQALIGIIDTGIDVLHQAFRDATEKRTRIIKIWDQRDQSGPPPVGRSFGTEHSQEAINDYIATRIVPDHLQVPPHDHGTHVASIAAGRATGDFSGGVAPAAGIVLVIPALKVEPGSPWSLGYSVSHLAALEYIRNVATALDLPAVINVSQGMSAGAHDGTSALEKGFDLITGNGREGGIVVVKSAGNERMHAGHASLSLPSESTESLRWGSTDAHQGLDVVELWFRASDRFKFRLRHPGGQVTEWVTWSNPTTSGRFPDGNSYGMDFVRYHRDNGDSRLLVTLRPGLASSIAAGTWSLEIESGLVKTGGEIHAWLERRNDRPIAFSSHVSEGITLSIPGTSHAVICVGSVSSSIPYRLAHYSSYGPTRDDRPKPDIASPGHEIRGALSSSLCGVAISSGTSMAAAHATGSIALLMSHWEKQRFRVPNWGRLNAAQIRAALTQSTQNYTGQWHRGMGYGVLDADKLLSALGRLP